MRRTGFFILAGMLLVPFLAYGQEQNASLPPPSGNSFADNAPVAFPDAEKDVPSSVPSPSGGTSEQPVAPSSDKKAEENSVAQEPALQPVLPDYPTIAAEDAPAEANRLSLAFRKEVGGEKHVSEARKKLWIRLAQQQLTQSDYTLTRPQVFVVVDRNPAVQRLALIMAVPGENDWQVIGVTKTSTGTTGRKYYYITPVGVFANTADILGYRALGTKNEHGIMGNGTKGMRVWDFGWQWAEKGWLPSREKGQIRLEMHATDPVYLERRLGHTASEGCVRIPAALNIFIDKHGLIDVEYERVANIDGRFKALLRKDRTPSPLAGSLLIVVDSAGVNNLSHSGKVADSGQKQQKIIR